MSLRRFALVLCLSFVPAAPSFAASFLLSDLRPGTGHVAQTELRGPQAYVADGALQFSIDWAALGGAPANLDLVMRWTNHVGPDNEGLATGDELSVRGYFSHGFTLDSFDLHYPDYERWSENAVAFGYAGLQPTDQSFVLVWDFFGWGDVIEWRLDYTLAPVPLPAAGLLLASALGLARLRRRRDR